jgi:hypothetical protein
MNASENFRAAMRLYFLRIRLALLTAIAAPLGALFWSLEQSRARAQTALSNEKAARERA